MFQDLFIFLYFSFISFFFPKGVEKALLYLEKEELPAHWDKALFMGLELLPSADEDSQDTDLDVCKHLNSASY